jgi:hypothetical protein
MNPRPKSYFVTIRLQASYTVEVFADHAEDAEREACCRPIPYKLMSDIEKDVSNITPIAWPRPSRVSTASESVPRSREDALG